MSKPDQSFPRKRRLRKSAEFDAVMQSARGAGNGAIVVFARRTDGEIPSRLGLAASRKVGNAVTRNRAKRRLREAFRTSESLRKGLEIVAVVNSPALNDVPLPQLASQLETLVDGSLKKGSRDPRRKVHR